MSQSREATVGEEANWEGAVWAGGDQGGEGAGLSLAGREAGLLAVLVALRVTLVLRLASRA